MCIRDRVKTHLNVEMAATEEMIEIAIRIKPDMVTLVPERPQEITTEGGLDVLTQRQIIKSAIGKLCKEGIFVGLFIDPDLKQIREAARLGAFQVEICTASYAHLNEEPGDSTVRRIKEIGVELERIRKAAKTAIQTGLQVAAGHGLTYRNVSKIAKIEGIKEFNIGHNIIARAALIGLDQAVREMIREIRCKD